MADDSKSGVGKRVALGVFAGVFVAAVATWWFVWREVDGGGTRSQEIDAYDKETVQGES